MDISVKRSSLGGSLSVPGSKSHTIRAVLLATMAEGASTIGINIFSSNQIIQKNSK